MSHYEPRMHRRGRRRLSVGLFMVAVSACALAACSSSTNNSSGSSTTTSTSTSGGTASQLATYRQPATFDAPGPAFNAKAAAGKTVWIIPTTTAVPLVVQTEVAMQSALTKLGVKSQLVTTAGLVPQWVSAITSAVSNHAGGIVLLGIDPSLVGPQLAAAAAAKIPVVQTYAILGQPVAPDLFGVVPIDYAVMAKAMSLEAVDATGGNAKILIVDSSELESSQALVPALKSDLAAECPNCSVVDSLDVPVASWSTEILPEVQTALTANKSINMVLATSDSMTLYIVPAIRLANPGKVKIVTEGASSSIVHEIPSGVIVGDIGWSNPWVGYASVDQVLRGMTGTAAVSTENVPLVLFDSTNIGQLPTGADPSIFIGTGYLNGYEGLWGDS